MRNADPMRGPLPNRELQALFDKNHFVSNRETEARIKEESVPHGHIKTLRLQPSKSDSAAVTSHNLVSNLCAQILWREREESHEAISVISDSDQLLKQT
jgi:hypothetical protein